jgi:hypothetical protein
LARGPADGFAVFAIGTGSKKRRAVTHTNVDAGGLDWRSRQGFPFQSVPNPAHPTIVSFKIPEKLHALEVGPDVFVFPEEATVGHWRAALKHWQNEGFIPHPREIKQMIKIADALGLSDDVVLLPHLKSLASAEKRSPNVLPIKLPGKK